MNDKYISDDDLRVDDILSSQIPEYQEPEAEQPSEPEPVVEEAPKTEAEEMLNTKILVGRAKQKADYQEQDKTLAARKGLTEVGGKISTSAEFREGWLDVDTKLLGERAIFYPESWQFRVRPATVEAIRNWSNIDDDNVFSVNETFNEVLRSCLTIVTPTGNIPWYNICTWDRFFFLLLIREYTFVQGEVKLEYEEDCPECDNPIKYELNSQTLIFEMPDPEVMPFYDRESRSWTVDPTEYGIEGDPIKLYIPTMEKDKNISDYYFSVLRANPKKKLDPTFQRFLPWMANRISKEESIAKNQIRTIEMKFKSLDMDMFEFMNDVIRNIAVVPSTKIKAKCEFCGEEAFADLRFPSGPSDLFSLPNKHKKFGSK